jgi:hypothetical protein
LDTFRHRSRFDFARQRTQYEYVLWKLHFVIELSLRRRLTSAEVMHSVHYNSVLNLCLLLTSVRWQSSINNKRGMLWKSLVWTSRNNHLGCNYYAAIIYRPDYLCAFSYISMKPYFYEYIYIYI